MNKFYFVAFTLIATASFSQTKYIFHKSHGGSVESFQKSLRNDLFTLKESNFGIAPQRYVRHAVLDTVELLSDSTVKVVTSERGGYFDEYTVATPRDNAKVWKAGTEVVLNHPVFSQKIPLDSMKQLIKKQYHFTNDPSTAVYIGFDKKVDSSTSPKKEKRKKERSRIQREEKHPVKTNSLIWFFIVAFTAVFAVGFNTKKIGSHSILGE